MFRGILMIAILVIFQVSLLCEPNSSQENVRFKTSKDIDQEYIIRYGRDLSHRVNGIIEDLCQENVAIDENRLHSIPKIYQELVILDDSDLVDSIMRTIKCKMFKKKFISIFSLYARRAKRFKKVLTRWAVKNPEILSLLYFHPRGRAIVMKKITGKCSKRMKLVYARMLLEMEAIEALPLLEKMMFDKSPLIMPSGKVRVNTSNSITRKTFGDYISSIYEQLEIIKKKNRK